MSTYSKLFLRLTLVPVTTIGTVPNANPDVVSDDVPDAVPDTVHLTLSFFWNLVFCGLGLR
jgi:hypothetical protein